MQGRVYENIHNIVNTNDLVTYVAFDSWDFARYGVDRVVPTKGDANYLNYKAKMLNEFYRIPNNGGNIYWPDHFQAWGIDPKDITSGDLGKIFKVNMTQAEFYADLCEAITTCLVSSRQDYADNLQDYLIALLGDIFGAADRDTSGVAESFAKKVQDNAKKLFYSLTIPGMLKNGTAVKLLTGYLVEALKENGIVTYDLDGHPRRVCNARSAPVQDGAQVPRHDDDAAGEPARDHERTFRRELPGVDALPVGHIYDQQTARQLRGTV